MRALQRAETGERGLAEARGACREVLLGERLQRGHARRAHQRRGGERAAVKAGLETAQAFPPDRGAERQSAPQRLAQDDDVRIEAVPRRREPATGAAEAGLDLVHDEKRAALATEPFEALQERGASFMDSAFALDDLHDDGGGVVADGAIGRREVVVGNVRRIPAPAARSGRARGEGAVALSAPKVRP